MTYPGNSSKFTQRDYSRLSDAQVIDLREQLAHQYHRGNGVFEYLQDVELELRNRGIDY